MSDEGRAYNAKFYRELEATRDSAEEILPIIVEWFHPHSIVDVGCGAGEWLSVAVKLGVNDILGVDGEWALKAKLAIPREKFLVHDLASPLKLDRKFDVAMALEVAEHLEAAHAETFVHSLCSASDRVLFSAAIPGQGGRRHLNEQWPSYWADLFAKQGYGCYDLLRARIWNNPRVLWYYAQNCLIFAREHSLDHLALPSQPLSLVHPNLWSAQVDKMNSAGKLLERLPKALFSTRKSKKE